MLLSPTQLPGRVVRAESTASQRMEQPAGLLARVLEEADDLQQVVDPGTEDGRRRDGRGVRSRIDSSVKYMDTPHKHQHHQHQSYAEEWERRMSALSYQHVPYFETVDDYEQHALSLKSDSSPDLQLRRSMETIAKVTQPPSYLHPPFLTIRQTERRWLQVLWTLRDPAHQRQTLADRLEHDKSGEHDIEISVQGFTLTVTGAKFDPDFLKDNQDGRVEAVDDLTNISWEMPGDVESFVTDCTLPGLRYRFAVAAHFLVSVDGEETLEVAPSVNKYFTTIGPPAKPDIRISDLDPLQVTVTWDFVETHPLVTVKGYQFYFERTKHIQTFPPQIRFPVITDLVPNSTHYIKMTILSENESGHSEKSNRIVVRVPPRPARPDIMVEPITVVGEVTISWRVPVSERKFERVGWYSIFIAGGGGGGEESSGQSEFALHEKIATEGDFCSYTFRDLNLGAACRCYVQAHAGLNEVSTSGYFGVCEVPSEPSNTVSFVPSAPPIPGRLRLVQFSNEGLTVSWGEPVEFGAAETSGYQMMRNREPYGERLPPETRQMTMSDVMPGERLELQLVALSDHVIGRKRFVMEGFTSVQYFMRAMTTETPDGQQRVANNASPYSTDSRKLQTVDGYDGCLPGAALSVTYTGLLVPPTDVHVLSVTGSTATVKWSRWSQVKSLVEHYALTESFRVSWWPAGGEHESRYLDTHDFQATIKFLRPSSTYCVTVEGRRQEDNNLLVSATSDVISFTTGHPPGLPGNLRVVDEGTDAATIAWEPPMVQGYQLLGYRVECRETLDGEREIQGSRRMVTNLPADVTRFTLERLEHTSRYLVVLMVLSDRFFEASPLDLEPGQPVPERYTWEQLDNQWLPYLKCSVTTACAGHPLDLFPSRVAPNAVLLKWVPGGSLEQVLTWHEYSESGLHSSRYLDQARVEGKSRALEVTGLEPATVYEFNLARTDRKGDTVFHHKLFLRTPAPIQPPTVFITGYTSSTISLEWNRPQLHLDHEGMFSTKLVHRDLIGYRVIINGKEYRERVGPDHKSVVLTKCTPGKTYSLVLVTVTGTHHTIRSGEVLAALGEMADQTVSAPVQVTMPERAPGSIHRLWCLYTSDPSDGPNALGYMKLSWSLFRSVHRDQSHRGALGVTGFDVVWDSSANEEHVYSVTLGPHESWLLLPVNKHGQQMRIQLVVHLEKESFPAQPLLVQAPGSPTPPKLSIYYISRHFFVFEWLGSEAQGGNAVEGYQTYINGRKAGNVLHPKFFRARVASRIDKVYQVSLVAISSDRRLPDSPPSDVISVSTDQSTIDAYASHTFSLHGQANIDDEGSGIGSVVVAPGKIGTIELALVEVTDKLISFRILKLNSDVVATLKVEWSCINSGRTHEMSLPGHSAVVNIETEAPGTKHFVKLFGLEGQQGQVVAKSRQMSVLTAAKLQPPPNLKPKRVSFTELVVGWGGLPKEQRGLVVGYRVFVNNRLAAEVDGDTHVFSFTQGHMCREYRFQVQALAPKEYLDSELSHPVVLLWPGLVPPVIHAVMTSRGNAIKIAWNPPFASKHVHILGSWVHCKLHQDAHERETWNMEKKQTVGPLPPEITSYQFENLATICKYEIHLELRVAGLDQFLLSNTLTLQPLRFPHAPTVRLVTLAGLSARRQLEAQLCRELQYWAEYLNQAASARRGTVSNIRDENYFISGAEVATAIQASYRKMEEMIAEISHHTGKIEGEIGWEAAPTTEASVLTGYRVLVNGKPIGNLLDPDTHTFKFRFSTVERVNRVSVASVVKDSATPVQESNEVEIQSSSFRPFGVFCYFACHSRNTRWPNKGCCAVGDMVLHEYTQWTCSGSKGAGKLAVAGLPGPLKTRREAPSRVRVYDLVNMLEVDLIPPPEQQPLSGRQHGTVIFFYTSWCVSSGRLLSLLLGWAGRNEQVQVTTCCVASGERAGPHYDSTLALVKGEKGWAGDNVRHVCGCFSGGGAAAKAERVLSREQTPKAAIATKSSVEGVFRLPGVPVISVVSGAGHVTWQGRALAADQVEFDSCMSSAMDTLRPRAF